MKTKIERITLTQISDVHLAPVTGLWPRHWNAKRLLGFLNWHYRRADIHRRDVVDRLIADMHKQKPAHIVVTGDLVNLGLPAELEQAKAWLASLGPPHAVSVIPGNHDIYVSMRRDIGVARWIKNMTSNDAGAALLLQDPQNENPSSNSFAAPGPSLQSIKKNQQEIKPASFPYCRVVGPLALIALNSSVPTAPFYATGIIGKEQCSALGHVLDRAREAGLVRVVLIHHPPLVGQAPRRRALRDASDLQDVLTAHGTELVLHGHNHRESINWIKGPLDSAPVIGVPSGSAARVHGNEPLARYNVIRIIKWNNHVRFDVTGRGLKKTGEPLSDLSLHSFEVRLA